MGRKYGAYTKRLLVCDLDNTLYDWVGYFVPAFYAMIDEAVRILECDRDRLLDDFKAVHQAHGDSEHPFALLETEVVKETFRGIELDQIKKLLDPAFHAFNSSRKAHLKLHDHVHETLDLLLASGVTLIAHTESKLFGALDRLNRLDLFRYFAKVYCRERSFASDALRGRPEWLSKFPMHKIRELSHHQSKPNPDVLLEICGAEGVDFMDAAYVGDSMARDILMAKRARVFAIWAAYGAKHDPETYAGLVRVTHWTPAEVRREQELKFEAQNIAPDFTATTSFAEVLEALRIAEKPWRVVHR